MLDSRLRQKLDRELERYESLERSFGEGGAVGSPEYADLLREHGSLAKRLAPFRELRGLERDRADHEEFRADPELRDEALREIARLDAEIESLTHRIAEALSPARKDDSKNAILEIRAGTGGEEAALFAADLLRMYTRFAEDRGWKIEMVSLNPSESGGMKEVILSVQGENVYRDLKHEGGGHRVQRVPATESQGRIHTSAATVAVLPEAEAYEVDLKPEELHIEVCRSQGPGGQSVNTTDSAVRIVHLPTGISVFMQEEKSQHKNKAKGLRIIRSRVYEHHQSQLDAARAADRRSQTGSGDRSERVRTYNFPQNRCTDHRLGQNFPLDRVIEGDLGKLVAALVDWGRQQELARA